MADAITTIRNKIDELQAQYNAAVQSGDGVEVARLRDIITPLQRAYNIDMTANAGNASPIYGGTPIVQMMTNTSVPAFTDSSIANTAVGSPTKNTMIYLALAAAAIFLIFRRR